MTQASTSAPENIHPAFELLRVCPIDALHIVVEEYRHRTTGAQHFHLRSDNTENVFLVALKTIPTDSTGVAHILEHTVLCGSENFPVRDPFFMMLRRSLNTFMNAMTSSDWTAYPFASQNRKDFDNLLRVYLDAVFFARLDPLDFAQEGHRLEFSDTDDAESPLLFKGVVYNEMKGAMSSVTSTLWQALSAQLYPSTTYHYNSGGEPQDIPDLSYDELLAFYRRHYHPGNAVFMTYGDIPAEQHQARFQSLCLERFNEQGFVPQVGDEKRYTAPIRVSDHYALEGETDTDAKTHIVIAWLLGKNTSLQDLLEAHLLSGALLDNSASPLRKALETSPLGTAPSPLCGMDDSNRELVLACGIEGSEPEHTEAIEQLVLSVCDDIVQNGLPQSQLEAVLHQLELHQREVGGDSYPFGLQLIMQGLGTAIHGGDPVELLDLDPVLDKLQDAIRDPDYIKQLVRRLLRDNNHRVTLTMAPDIELAQQRLAAEGSRLADIKTGLGARGAQDIIQRSHDLLERQQMEDDQSVLPDLTLADVPGSTPPPTARHLPIGGLDTCWYAAATNGLVYQQYVLAVPGCDESQTELLAQHTGLLTELGLGQADYLQVQERQAATCGSISAFSSIRGHIDNPLKTDAFVTLSAKALNRNYGAMTELMLDTLTTVRFDELPRLRELVAQQRAHREQSVTGSGHSLAMMAAAASLNPLATHNHHSAGLAGIKRLKNLDQKLDSSDALESFAEDLAALQDRLNSAQVQILTVCEANKEAEFEQQMAAQLPTRAVENQSRLILGDADQMANQVWQANTQVNFCARAYPTVGMAHEDAPVLSVLGGFLRNGYLHSAIREKGGAYGAGANQDSNIGGFLFFSYRDPRLTDTLDDFDQAINWLLHEKHSRESVEQAILGVVGSLDKPSSPAGEAKKHFHNLLFGRSDEQREQYRQRVLNVTEQDLKRVAETWLSAESSRTALITSPASIASLQEWIDQHSAAVHQL